MSYQLHFLCRSGFTHAMLAVALCLCAATPAVAQSAKVKTLVWGSYLSPPSVQPGDANNAKFEIYAKPSLVVWSPGPKVDLAFYAIVAVLADSEKQTYNNKFKAALGVELRYQLTPATRLSFGVRYDTERLHLTGDGNAGLVLTADMSIWKSWRPKWVPKLGTQQPQLVFSSWANIRAPGSLSETEKSNTVLQGAAKLSAVYQLGQTRLKLAPFIAVKAKADRRKRAYNNHIEPSIGLDLKIPLGKGGELSLGVKHATQYRTTTLSRQSGQILYLSWYKNF